MDLRLDLVTHQHSDPEYPEEPRVEFKIVPLERAAKEQLAALSESKKGNSLEHSPSVRFFVLARACHAHGLDDLALALCVASESLFRRHAGTFENSLAEELSRLWFWRMGSRREHTTICRSGSTWQ